MNILDEIIQSTKAEVAERKRTATIAPVSPTAPAGRLRDALAKPGIKMIAEIKRRSPSAGEMRTGVEVDAIALAYERGGADALSVLTERPHFGGRLEDLRAARAACDLPILRKDFIVDEFQLQEAALAGADGVLLIVAALAPKQLAELRAQAHELGLDALVEVHDESELEIALAAGAEIVGINNRDLRDFTVDVERTFALLVHMPDGMIVVSESGISSHEQLQRLESAGVSAVLVGESLMRAQDPAAALIRLRGG